MQLEHLVKMSANEFNSNCSLVPRLPDLFNVSAHNFEKLGIGPENDAKFYALICCYKQLRNLLPNLSTL